MNEYEERLMLKKVVEIQKIEITEKDKLIVKKDSLKKEHTIEKLSIQAHKILQVLFYAHKNYLPTQLKLLLELSIMI